MAYTEQELSDIAGDEIILSDKELEIFSLMSRQEIEEYRSIKYPEYIDLMRIENLLGSGRIQGEDYELEIHKLKNIFHRCPSPEDAKAELEARVIQEYDL